MKLFTSTISLFCLIAFQGTPVIADSIIDDDAPRVIPTKINVPPAPEKLATGDGPKSSIIIINKVVVGSEPQDIEIIIDDKVVPMAKNQTLIYSYAGIGRDLSLSAGGPKLGGAKIEFDILKPNTTFCFQIEKYTKGIIIKKIDTVPKVAAK